MERPRLQHKTEQVPPPLPRSARTTSPAAGDSKAPGHGFAIPLRLQAPGPMSTLAKSATTIRAWPSRVSAENLRYLAGCPADRSRLGPRRLSREWDDLRLVGLRLIFLTVSSVMSLFRLSRREGWWKDAEILMLRHQLAVARRERPRAHSRLTWPDRAWLALLAGTVPTGRLAAMRLIVTPGTIVRWHRDIVRRRWARRSRRGRSGLAAPGAR